MIKDFKSFVFVSVDVKGLADANFVSVDVKALTSREGSFGSLRSLRTTIPAWMVVFVSVDVKGLADANFVSVDAKGLMRHLVFIWLSRPDSVLLAAGSKWQDQTK